ncbi:MAG TPA: hypothetical protein VFF06_23170 [Polyangia bacterium]|nr:hypothetical protein [Polyangia bacterium]
MSLRAPLRVPVELRARTRWFRLAHAVGLDGLSLGSAAPDEAEGALDLAFHLPGDARPIRCRARVHEVVVDRGERETERAEKRDVRFLDLDEDGRARIERYVEERLGLNP